MLHITTVSGSLYEVRPNGQGTMTIVRVSDHAVIGAPIDDTFEATGLVMLSTVLGPRVRFDLPDGRDLTTSLVTSVSLPTPARL